MDIDIWTEACSRLEQGKPTVAATIATSDGSTPRSAGAKMLLGPDGFMLGSLGGGLAEAEAIREAAKTMTDGRPRLISVDMSGSAASGADLICGGRVRIFIQLLLPEWAGTFCAIAKHVRKGLDILVSTVVSEPGEPGRPIISLSGETAEPFPDGTFLAHHDGIDTLFEPLRAPFRLILAGGGHVSRATAKIAAMTGFVTTILDDRPEFADQERFPWLPASQLVVVPGFANCFAEETLGFPITRKSFIAILTRGHSFDGEALGQALRLPAGYIGMIGSRRKRDTLYDQLEARGFSREALAAVHCPIGIGIGGDTAEEIAVSIVAEIISERTRILSEQ